VTISFTELKNYLSIGVRMEKKPKEVERLFMTESGPHCYWTK